MIKNFIFRFHIVYDRSECELMENKLDPSIVRNKYSFRENIHYLYKQM